MTEHVVGAAIRMAIGLLEAGRYVSVKPTPDGIYVGDPCRPHGLVFRPAAGLESTHVDIYQLEPKPGEFTPALTFKGRFLPQEIL